MRALPCLFAYTGLASFVAVACSSSVEIPPPPDAGQPLPDATVADANVWDVTYVEAGPDASIAHPCTLPGSIQYGANGITIVGDLPTGSPDLSFLHLPAGFCAHYFARIPNARQIRFAPGG